MAGPVDTNDLDSLGSKTGVWSDLRYLGAFVGLVGTAVICVWSFVAAARNPIGIASLAQPAYRVLFGLPFAVLVAAAVVALFRTAEGPIEFEALTFKFKGASGEIVMWLACFLALTMAINLLRPVSA